MKKRFTVKASKTACSRRKVMATTTNDYRVEFNASGFYGGAGIWDTVDELVHVSADSAQEAIELAKDWWIETSSDVEQGESEVREYAWRAAENRVDEDGYPESYNWEFED